jgi:Protein of unknown function (DUF3168)
MIDFMAATLEAVFVRLKAAPVAAIAQVCQHVLEDTKPPMVIIGAIDTNDESSSEQSELISFEIHSIYRGTDRRELSTIMHRVREALDGRAGAPTLVASGVDFSKVRFVDASASGVANDGVTYAGISNFEVWASA